MLSGAEGEITERRETGMRASKEFTSSSLPAAESVVRKGNIDPIEMENLPAVEPLIVPGGGRSDDAEGFSTASSKQDPDRGATLWATLRNVVAFNSSLLAQTRKKPTPRVDSFLERFTLHRRGDIGREDPEVCVSQDRLKPKPKSFTVDPACGVYFYWLFFVTLAFEYNIWFVIAREAWPGLQEQATTVWFVLDYLCDFIYLLDIVVQFRTAYLDQGILVTDARFIALRYARSWRFAVDVLALIPSDLLYLVVDAYRLHPIVRFPRFLKYYRMRVWSYMIEVRATEPHVFRVLNICHILLLLVHWFAAFYFLVSEAIGFGNGQWVYPAAVGEFNSTARMYLMSFYRSTLTLTLLGDIPEPDSIWEYVFQIVSYLIGVVFFATIVGQVGTVIENRNLVRLEFERHVDNAKKYMSSYKVPKDVQQRVLLWYFYTWQRAKTDISSLGLLPDKLKTELAIHVHLQTLKKVSIFNKCPPEFLHDLVLKMHLCIFTPGDLVCRKGEVAREMFIISDGFIEVLSSDGTVLIRLQAGDFFGEIGLLNLEGTANRRTADVRSVGFSELFLLSKEDMLAALDDFPQAQKILEDEAARRLNMASDAMPVGRHRDGSRSGSNRGASRLAHKRKTSSKRRVAPHPSSTSGYENTAKVADKSPTTRRPRQRSLPKSAKPEHVPTRHEQEAWLTDVIKTVHEVVNEKMQCYMSILIIALAYFNSLEDCDLLTCRQEEDRRRNKQLRLRVRELEYELKLKDKKRDELVEVINLLREESGLA